MKTLYQSELPELDLVRRGKVREVYDLGENLLFVASDRISAFDVIMDEAIPEKGKLLTQISIFWFNQTKNVIANHFVTADVKEFPANCAQYAEVLDGRSMIVKKCTPLAVEFIIRGYVAGSGWKEYQKQGSICGIKLPEGLREYQKLPEPIFTPTTKADVGHDENIDFAGACDILGVELAEKLRDVAIKLYVSAEEYLRTRGIILADTKFEFGIDAEGAPMLIDEALTPDSSRFWLAETYEPGKFQTNFDKQVLRDYLETLDWNKQAPAPALPDSIINAALDKYKMAYKMITGNDFK